MNDENRSSPPDRPRPDARETRRVSAKSDGSSGGIDTYTNWLNRVGDSAKRRKVLPPALHNIQAYKSWAAKIRRDWKEPETSES